MTTVTNDSRTNSKTSPLVALLFADRSSGRFGVGRGEARRNEGGKKGAGRVVKRAGDGVGW